MNQPSMSFNREGKENKPLKIFTVNGKYLLGVYQGSLSEFDLLLKYRQKDNKQKSGWSRLRTPKHIHWAVDVLIKMNQEKNKTKELLHFLIEYWENKAVPIKNKTEQSKILKSSLIKDVILESKKYSNLEGLGEYSIKFLIMIAKLLMIQEKTNRHDAYMFKNLLTALKQGEDIFKIVSVATHSGR
jgi:hypothetical protein